MASEVRFLLDENINYPDTIIAFCAEFGVSVTRVHELGLEETDDAIIFPYAIEHEYLIVTNNIYEFRPMYDNWLKAGNESPGIVFVPNTWKRQPYKIAEKLIDICDDYTLNLEYWVGE